MCAKAVLKAEMVDQMGFGREPFDALVSVNMLPATKRLSNQPWPNHSVAFVTLYQQSNKVALPFLL
jgi:hypothetical protein